ncbi:DUF7522 family protein [Halobaculum halobium]|uniref:SMI1/KNR4 family protein n=1 Tax=Halobaculum halobium TaxID=3032281 RepID=A0ABD5T5W0_9EURY|nr:hypothetical protein [Halobaculum sp. SYNS20]
MSQEAANRLVEYLDAQADDYLRGAIHYSEGGYESLYLREDVDALYSDQKMQELCDYYRHQSNVQTAEEPFSLGNCHCNVSFYDDAIIFHFAQGDDIGTVVTLEPEAGRNIVGFITQCLKQLHFNSPQSIENVPEWLQD